VTEDFMISLNSPRKLLGPTVDKTGHFIAPHSCCIINNYAREGTLNKVGRKLPRFQI